MKKIIKLVVILILLFAVNVFAYNYISESRNLILKNEQPIKFNNPIYTVDDLTYVPLREFCEKLGISLKWNQDRQQIVLDVNNKTVLYDKNIEANHCLENGVIPDEEAAKKVAKSILEACTGKPMEYKDGDYEYFLTVDFSETQNCWLVTQYAKYKGEFFGGGNVSPHIRINKSTGEVIYINLDPSWDGIRQVHQTEH